MSTLLQIYVNLKKLKKSIKENTNEEYHDRQSNDLFVLSEEDNEAIERFIAREEEKEREIIESELPF